MGVVDTAVVSVEAGAGLVEPLGATPWTSQEEARPGSSAEFDQAIGQSSPTPGAARARSRPAPQGMASERSTASSRITREFHRFSRPRQSCVANRPRIAVGGVAHAGPRLMVSAARPRSRISTAGRPAGLPNPPALPNPQDHPEHRSRSSAVHRRRSPAACRRPSVPFDAGAPHDLINPERLSRNPSSVICAASAASSTPAPAPTRSHPSIPAATTPGAPPASPRASPAGSRTSRGCAPRVPPPPTAAAPSSSSRPARATRSTRTPAAPCSRASKSRAPASPATVSRSPSTARSTTATTRATTTTSPRHRAAPRRSA